MVTPSPEAAVAAICDYAIENGAGLPAITAYAAAVYRHITGSVPAHHAPAFAAAEAEIGTENADLIAAWVADNRDFIATMAAPLDAMRDLDPSPSTDVPPGALAAGRTGRRGVGDGALGAGADRHAHGHQEGQQHTHARLKLQSAAGSGAGFRSP